MRVVWLILFCLLSVSVYAETLTISAPPTASIGDRVDVDFSLTGASDLAGYQFDLFYDNTKLSFNAATEGPFLKNGCSDCTFFTASEISGESGLLTLAIRLDGASASGQGSLAKITFDAIASGTSTLLARDMLFIDSNDNERPITQQSDSIDIVSNQRALFLYDDTDTQQRFVGDEVLFQASYEYSNGDPVVGATCRMSLDNFQSTNYPMIYSASSGTYLQTGTFDTPGEYMWYANCDGDLAEDNFIIQGPSCIDDDNDGYNVEGGQCGQLDCNDDIPTINPGAQEVCGNSIDDNCNNQVDENCNVAPVLQHIDNEQVSENALLEIVVLATDADGDSLTYSTGGLPSGASFNPTTRTFSWTPTFGQANNYNVQFTVTDEYGASDSQTVTITVGDVNRAPVLKTIANEQVSENALLEIVVLATDADGDSLTYSTGGLPSGASFNPTTRTFSWTPTYGQADNYNIQFTVTDTKGASDSQTVTITVGDVNRAPELNPISNVQKQENELVQFTILATDQDGDDLTYSASSLPQGASFNPTTRTFSWTPTFGQANNYQVQFTVDDNNGGSDSQTVIITIGDVNRAPELENIGDQQINENEEKTITLSATDLDGDTLTYSTSNLPSGATFNPMTRTFSWTPGYGDSDSYPNILFRVDDNNGGSDSESITITVGDVNRAPQLQTIGNKQIDENKLLDFYLSASDLDGDDLTFSAANLPAGASFSSTTGYFAWTPGFGASGNYPVIFTVTDDNGGSDSESITITVGDVNRAPQLQTIGNKQIDENSLLSFQITASDLDGDDLTYSTSSLPSGALFNANTKTFSWTPTFGQADNYNVRFTVSDTKASTSEEITITVGDINRIPELSPIGNQQKLVGETLKITLLASDSDGDDIIYSVTGQPTGATLNGNTFTWTPVASQVGVHQGIIFTANDNNGGVDTEEISITIGPGNQPPVLQSIGNSQVNVGQQLYFIITASDTDGDTLTFSTKDLPSDAQFTPNGNTALFNWTPISPGNYPITIIVSDGEFQDNESIILTAGDVNRPPTLQSLGNLQVIAGLTASFTLSASDLDGDTLTYSATSLPPGASLQGVNFTWKTNESMLDGSNTKNYTVTFTVRDNGSPQESDSQTIILTLSTPPITCSDGTADATCSSSKPQYCTGTTLAPNCQQCGCTSGLSCKSDGTCQKQTTTSRPSSSGGGGGGGGSGGGGGFTSGPRIQSVGSSCTEEWSCNEWSACIDGVQTRSCTDKSSCATGIGKPALERSCTSSCSDGIMNGDEQGIDCGGMCGECSDSRLGITLQETSMQGSLESAFTLQLPIQNTGSELAENLVLRIDELGLEQIIGPLLPGENGIVSLSIDSITLLNKKQIHAKVFQGNTLLADIQVPVSIEVPELAAFIRVEDDGTNIYLVHNNIGGQAKGGSDFEITIQQEGNTLFSDLLGSYAIPKNEIYVHKEEFPVMLKKGTYDVQSTLYVKGEEQATAITTSQLEEGSKFSIRGILLLIFIIGLVAALVLIVDVFFFGGEGVANELQRKLKR